jgi:hypothetical protein
VSLLLAIACVTYPATARPWRRGHPKRGGEERRRRKRTKGPALSPDWRARVLGCTLVQGRRTRAASCANANESANTTQRRDHERYDAAYYGYKEEFKPASERASMKAAAPARNLIPAWHEGRHHQRRCGGAEHRAFHLGSMAGATTRGEKRLSSPLWPLAEVQASVQSGGAACPRGGRRGRRRRVVGEVEEAGEVVVPGGSGSSHGRLRSSRRSALPRAAPISPSPPSLLLLLRRVGGGQGSDFPPEAARVGSSPGGSTVA